MMKLRKGKPPSGVGSNDNSSGSNSNQEIDLNHNQNIGGQMIGSQANIDDNLRYTARLNTGRGGSRNPSRNQRASKKMKQPSDEDFMEVVKIFYEQITEINKHYKDKKKTNRRTQKKAPKFTHPRPDFQGTAIVEAGRKKSKVGNEGYTLDKPGEGESENSRQHSDAAIDDKKKQKLQNDIDMNDESKKKGSPYRFGDDSLNKNDLSMFLKSKPNQMRNQQEQQTIKMNNFPEKINTQHNNKSQINRKINSQFNQQQQQQQQQQQSLQLNNSIQDIIKTNPFLPFYPMMLDAAGHFPPSTNMLGNQEINMDIIKLIQNQQPNLINYLTQGNYQQLFPKLSYLSLPNLQFGLNFNMANKANTMQQQQQQPQISQFVPQPQFQPIKQQNLIENKKPQGNIPFRRAATHVAIAYFIHMRRCTSNTTQGDINQDKIKFDPTYYARKLKERKQQNEGYNPEYMSDQQQIQLQQMQQMQQMQINQHSLQQISQMQQKGMLDDEQQQQQKINQVLHINNNNKMVQQQELADQIQKIEEQEQQPNKSIDEKIEEEENCLPKEMDPPNFPEFAPPIQESNQNFKIINIPQPQMDQNMEEQLNQIDDNIIQQEEQTNNLMPIQQQN